MKLDSLHTRIIVFFSLLLAAVLAVVFAVVARENLQIARQHNQDELRVGERVFKRLLTQNQAQLAQAATVLAADFGFRGAVSSEDFDTIVSALNNHGRRIEADLMLLVALDGTLIADTVRPARTERLAAAAALLREAETEGRAAGLVSLERTAYQMVVVPVLAPDPIAWVMLGFVIDDRFAHELRSLTSAEVSFLELEPATGWATLASTLSPALRDAMARGLRDVRAPQGSSLVLGDFDTLVLPLAEADGPVIAAVLQRSIRAAASRLQPLLRTLGVLAVLSIVLSLLGSALIARKITEPIKRLASVARRIRDGDYSQPIDVPPAGEIGAFAATFDHMRDAIAAREREIRRLAYEDGLTGLPNRSMIMDRLTHLASIGKRTGQDFAVMLLDLDRFRDINDTLGHEAGDQVLEVVSRRLRHTVRASDTVARLGGDEFAILLPTGATDEGALLAERIHDALDQPIVAGQQLVDVSASIGLAHFPAHGDDAGTLLRRSDIAMYAAKRGRSGFAVYDPRYDEHRQDRLHLLGDLRRAITEGELALLYQPKVELGSGLVRGVEALIRWHHPGRGLVPPAEFIPFAEHTGAIRQITQWVVGAAVRQCAAWHAAGEPLQVSLNISARDLVDGELVHHLRRTLDAADLPAGLLCLEITESALMDDPSNAHATVLRLHEMGLRLAIDDYGTGYSSLAYVKDLPVDEIKIDRAFVGGIATHPDNAAIVRSTIELGHNLGLLVVAEGVESERELALLRELECDLAQGFYLSRPLAIDALADWRARHPSFPMPPQEAPVLPLRRRTR